MNARAICKCKCRSEPGDFILTTEGVRDNWLRLSYR